MKLFFFKENKQQSKQVLLEKVKTKEQTNKYNFDERFLFSL